MQEYVTEMPFELLQSLLENRGHLKKAIYIILEYLVSFFNISITLAPHFNTRPTLFSSMC